MTIATEGAAGSASQDGGRFGHQELEAFTTAALVALGAPAGTAGQVATSLVLSNLVGHDSHGFIRLVQYSGWVADGQIRPAAQPAVSQRQGAIAVIDGNWGFGQSAARLAVDVVAQAAAENGVAAVTIRDCNHVGRLGEYVTALAGQGLAGL
ncbi:MAG TPA: Ldh family oxidoreductase, partial [Streptosporangiaceae bacterium]